jgi:hypothetical protein
LQIFFLLESPCVLFLLFLAMVLWLLRAALLHRDSSVYLQLEGFIMFSLYLADAFGLGAAVVRWSIKQQSVL